MTICFPRIYYLRDKRQGSERACPVPDGFAVLVPVHRFQHLIWRGLRELIAPRRRLCSGMTLKGLLASTLCAALLPATAPAADLPVRTVTLYKHGIGWFGRQGTIPAGESARLDFKSGEMNDVLKSLTIVDQGGKVTGLRYDSSIPLEEKLADLPFAIEKGQPLSALLDQVKGARIEMEFGTQKVAGAIVAARLIAGDKEHSEREQATIYLDTGELRNVDLGAAAAIRFTDPKLQAQLRNYLTAVTDSRSKERRSLYIDSTDAKAHDVRAEYIIPMPAWKSSYRLLFDPAGTSATLEGWAIVDNTTGEDWTNVRMSLISGRPVSFVSQLYPPKYTNRPGAELAEDKPVAPGVYSGAVADTALLSAPKTAMMLGGNAGGVTGGVVGAVPSGGGAEFSMRRGDFASRPSSVAASASTQELADLFEYSIDTPVTVRRDESAMLPFVQQKVTARKLLIYSDMNSSSPMSAAEITNTTGKTLDGGPLTVYDAGAYAGEALVETVKAADKRFISYGLDLGTRITTALNSHNDDVRELHIRNGLLLTKGAMAQTRTYTIRNVDARAKTLIIEFPVRTGYTLTNTAKPFETTGDVYRFEVKVPAAGTVEFPVTDENVYDRQFSLSSLTPDAVAVYVRNRTISEAARTQLERIVDLKGQITQKEGEKRTVSEQIQSASQDEERTRQNIISLQGVAGQQQTVQGYALTLSEHEDAISKMRQRQSAADQQIKTLQGQLTRLIESLNF